MDPEFSICIPALNNKHIRECLDSIFASRFQDFEVIINDASDQFYVSDQISDYDVKIIKKRTRSFESRMVTTRASTGNRIMIFDDTRLVSDSLFDKLIEMPENMIVIAERDMGHSILIKLSNLDKSRLNNDTIKLDPIKNKSVIPRVYKRGILLRAFESINNNLGPEIIKNMVGLDLEIIYYEAFKISHNVGIISTPEILHYGDETLKSVFHKYYKYGFTQRMLRGTIYSELANISGRTRSTYDIGSRILSLPLQVVRGVPFILGYISGSNAIPDHTFDK
jgi:hypothetical protein